VYPLKEPRALSLNITNSYHSNIHLFRHVGEEVHFEPRRMRSLSKNLCVCVCVCVCARARACVCVCVCVCVLCLFPHVSEEVHFEPSRLHVLEHAHARAGRARSLQRDRHIASHYIILCYSMLYHFQIYYMSLNDARAGWTRAEQRENISYITILKPSGKHIIPNTR
jgi:hypothetical protein